MNATGNSADPCAVCYGALEGGWFPYSLLPAFIRRLLSNDSVLTLKPCGHKFHFACINQWLNLSQRCPLDRRVITGCDPPSLLSINLQQALFNAIECNRIEDVQDILLSGLTPEQLSRLDQRNPLTMASVNGRWAIAGQLLRAGWTTEDKVALTNLGCMYRQGRAIEQDFTNALLCYRKAADQGYARAQNCLGWMYEGGLGVEQDFTEALSWYLKAACQGFALSQSYVGLMYERGRAVRQDYAEALSWYLRAACQGCAPAQDNLGRVYEQGLGVTQDYTEALSWRLRAASQGFAPAQNSLGWMYERGLGVEQDDTRACSWYHKAAVQGYSPAQDSLGRMYEKGLGVKRDYAEALSWYSKAAAKGNRTVEMNSNKRNKPCYAWPVQVSWSQ